MAAAIKFYANNVSNTGSDSHTVEINHGAGSGLGFYGAGYGISVPLNDYQTTTFTTKTNTFTTKTNAKQYFYYKNQCKTVFLWDPHALRAWGP